jgi:hypothetical protein
MMETNDDRKQLESLAREAIGLGGRYRGAVELDDVAEEFDFNDRRFAHVVERAAQFIYSSDSDTRSIVLASLCGGRPVMGYEWVALEGWKRAEASDIHCYADAMEATHTTREQILPSTVLVVADHLLRFARAGDEPDISDLEAVERWWDLKYYAIAANDVLAAFDRVLRGLPRESSVNRYHRFADDVREGRYGELRVDWRMVAGVLYGTFSAS